MILPAVLFLLGVYPMTLIGVVRQKPKESLYWQVVGPTTVIDINALLEKAPTKYTLRVLLRTQGKFEHLLYLRECIFPIRTLVLQWKRRSDESTLYSIIFMDGSGKTYMVYKSGDTWSVDTVTVPFYKLIMSIYSRK